MQHHNNRAFKPHKVSNSSLLIPTQSVFLKKKTTAGFFASAGSSLLVMRNLDQSIQII